MITQDSLETVLSFLNLEYEAKSTSLLTRCPYAKWKHQSGVDSNPSARWYFDRKEQFFHCFSCRSNARFDEVILELRALGYVGDLDSAFKLLMDESFAVPPKSFKEAKIKSLPSGVRAKPPDYHIFDEEWLKSFKLALNFRDARKYLKDRKLTDEMIIHFDVRYDTHRKRVCFPLRTIDGLLVGLHGRYIGSNEKMLKYLAYDFKGEVNAYTWLNLQNMDLSSPVVMAESVFDLTAIYPYYPNVISPLTASLSMVKLATIPKISSVISAFDSDKAGDYARTQLAKWGKFVLHRYPNPYKDFGGASKSVIEDCFSFLLKK